MYLFYVACGSAQGGYAIRAGADRVCLQPAAFHVSATSCWQT